MKWMGHGLLLVNDGAFEKALPSRTPYQPAQTWQLQAQQKNAGFVAIKDLQKRFGGVKDASLHACRAQQRGKRREHFGVVNDDVNGRVFDGVRHAFPCT